VYDPIGYALNGSGVTPRYIRAQRTPGAESGWNNHNQFVQHKHTYEVEVQKPFNRYNGSKKEEIPAGGDYSFAPAASKFNENEIFPGNLSVLFNLYDKGRWNYGTSFFDYRFYKPAGGSGKLPLFVWLHGADGSRITDATWTSAGFPEELQNTGHLSIGSAGVLVSPMMQNKYGPFYVLAPQANNGHNPTQIKALIDDLISKYPIDSKRVYVAGHSMGGMATVNLLTEFPDFFAAAAPAPGSIGGGFGPPAPGTPTTDEVAQKLKLTPLWLFTIRGDSSFSDALTITAYNAVRNAGGNNVRMTYFPVNADNDSSGNTGYDYPGNFGAENDPVLAPVGPGGMSLDWSTWPPTMSDARANKLVAYDWSHSGYEPLMSDTVTTDHAYNVGGTNGAGNYTGVANRTAHTGFQWNYRNPLDDAGDTVFAWMFKQRRTAE
jgi:pimeloyl-ACP methyl ester carboxylesterase